VAEHRVQHEGVLIDVLIDAAGLKRSNAKDRLKKGQVSVNGEPVFKATAPVHAGDVIAVHKEGVRRPSARGPELLHVDHDLVVINKPSGLLTVRGGRPGKRGKGGAEPTVLDQVGPQLRGERRLFPCHRLDRETSGVLLLPRSKEIQQHYFATWGDVEKVYVAVVEGLLDDDELRIDAPLLEDERSLSVRVSHTPEARTAATRVRVRARGRKHTLIEAWLETGRKHQIRVHLAHVGHPVLGDKRYGTAAGAAPRLCLHATRLTFEHARTGEVMTFEVAPPALFERLLDG
jgi:23S rRNA pseudouridine1911/1915/1917 synthase